MATMHSFLPSGAPRAFPRRVLTGALAALAALAGPGIAQARLDLAPVAPPAPAAAPVEADAEPHPVLDRIRASGHIVLAHRESSVPFSYYDANHKPIGYSIDLCKDLAETIRKHLGLKTLAIDYVPITTANRIETIVSGKADLECGVTTNNAERRKQVAFTVPHYITGTRYAVRADSPIAELDQFDGHVLVSTAGSTPFLNIDAANRERLMNIRLQAVSDNAKAMQMLADGRADGFAMDDVQLYGLIAESPDPKKFKVVGKFLTIEPLAIMMSKDDAALKKVVDEEMKRMIRSGEAEQIYDRWFLKPIPPRNVSLNLPMNYLLRDWWRYPTDEVQN